MSIVNAAIKQIYRTIDRRVSGVTSFRAVVVGTSGNLTTIQRLGASTADAEPYAKVTADTFTAGDEVMCTPVNGKPVIIGKVRR